MGLCQILLLRDCPIHMKMDTSVTNVSHLLQGPEHPNPGMPYTARGFPRYCYLPDNEKGRKVRYHTLITSPFLGCQASGKLHSWHIAAALSFVFPFPL